MWRHTQHTPSQEALTDDPTLPSKKISWLQRHERQCGGVTVMLPIVVGVPTVLTDHLDRSPERRPLQGALGFIHSVHLHIDDEKASKASKNEAVYVLQHLPTCVYVQFPGAKWTIPGCDA